MDKYIDIDGVKLHYTDTGRQDGPTVVLMHGWGCEVKTVASIAAVLEPGMRVLSLDLPGHGQTPEPPEIWGVEKYTQFVEKFISRLALRDVTLIGHSFGGRIGILLSSRNDYVRKLVLVDAAGVKPRHGLKWYAKVYTYKALKHTLPVILGKSLGTKMLERYRGKARSADYRNSTPVMRGILSKCVNEDLCHVMPSIKAPTLLVWGELDTATPLNDAKIMNRLIPDSGIASFKGCGHYSFLDNPAGFRAVMREFFKKELAGS